MRINKYLAHKNLTTRREADTLISAGKVLINGRKAALGDKVTGSDNVEVRFRAKKYSYFAYNKPRGIITHSPGEGEKGIKESVPLPGFFPIGRLDKDSSGLIILTDDGRITDKLLNPDYAHEKEYLVSTKEKLSASFKRKMEAGVDIEGYMTKPCTVNIMGENRFSIVLTEGKKHQIRRMCAALGIVVSELERKRIMNIHLGKLPRGKFRALTGNELATFLKALGM